MKQLKMHLAWLEFFEMERPRLEVVVKFLRKFQLQFHSDDSDTS